MSARNRDGVASYVRLGAVALGLAAYVPSAKAVLVEVDEFQTNGTASLTHTFSPSNSDLLTGLTATTSAGIFTQEGAGGVPVLNNGTMANPVSRSALPDLTPTGQPPFQFSTFATGGNTGGTSVTYTLASASNITSIAVYGGWQDGGRDQQSFSVFAAPAATPTVFSLTPIATVNYQPPNPNGFPQVTRVTLSDNAGNLASNIGALRFDFNATENGYSGYAEIDVIGSAVPEPAAVATLAVGGLALLGRRRRNS